MFCLQVLSPFDMTLIDELFVRHLPLFKFDKGHDQ